MHLQVKQYFKHCIGLSFTEEPDYRLLKKIFKTPGHIDWNERDKESNKYISSDSGVSLELTRAEAYDITKPVSTKMSKTEIINSKYGLSEWSGVWSTLD